MGLYPPASGVIDGFRESSPSRLQRNFPRFLPSSHEETPLTAGPLSARSLDRSAAALAGSPSKRADFSTIRFSSPIWCPMTPPEPNAARVKRRAPLFSPISVQMDVSKADVRSTARAASPLGFLSASPDRVLGVRPGAGHAPPSERASRPPAITDLVFGRIASARFFLLLPGGRAAAVRIAECPASRDRTRDQDRIGRSRSRLGRSLPLRFARASLRTKERRVDRRHASPPGATSIFAETFTRLKGLSHVIRWPLVVLGEHLPIGDPACSPSRRLERSLLAGSSRIRERLGIYKSRRALSGSPMENLCAYLRRQSLGFTIAGLKPLHRAFVDHLRLRERARNTKASRPARGLNPRIGPPKGLFAPYRAFPSIAALIALQRHGDSRCRAPNVHRRARPVGGALLRRDEDVRRAPLPCVSEGRGSVYHASTRRRWGRFRSGARPLLHAIRGVGAGNAARGNRSDRPTSRSRRSSRSSFWEAASAWAFSAAPMLECGLSWLKHHRPVRAAVSAARRLPHGKLSRERLSHHGDPTGSSCLSVPARDLVWICNSQLPWPSPYMCHLS